MFHIRKIQSIVIASAALCCHAAAVSAAEPNVTYAANGIFATPAVSGEDVFFLAGEPFTITFVVNEATKPSRHSETIAEYSNILVDATATTGAGGETFTYNGPASLFLVVGAPGKPDWIILSFPFSIFGDTVTFTSKIRMPAGTITTPAIRPFTAPVTFTPADGQLTYACPACPPPWTGHSTTLAMAGGALTAIAQ
jgi:hypothetical protein